jgi:Alpha amylase, catalytic domain
VIQIEARQADREPVAERFGKASDFQQFVDLCHQDGIAVIVGSVYGHTCGDFAYTQLYSALQGDLPNPFNGGSGEVGTLNDFTKKLTQDYYYSVNQFGSTRFTWMDSDSTMCQSIGTVPPEQVMPTWCLRPSSISKRRHDRLRSGQKAEAETYRLSLSLPRRPLQGCSTLCLEARD